MHRVVFLLTPGLHLLDLAGPAQVFSEMTALGHEYAVHYVADRPEIRTAQGLEVRADTEWPALAVADLVLVPGWRTSSAAGRLSSASLRRLIEHHAGGGTVASVCSGADALGRAGLLDGRRFTTHHELQDEMARRYPAATVVKDVLFVEDGRIVTSAGIASGIDLALHLIAERHGPGVAARVARSMVVYARRNGEAPQASAMLRHRAHLSDAVHRVQEVIEARLAERLPLTELAELSGCSERTITRMFVRATGLTPLRYQQALRLERAEHLIDQGETVELAARAVGFEDARMLRRLRSRVPEGPDTDRRRYPTGVDSAADSRSGSSA
ncbi:MAG TPA: DJ-1/PfpI family protein [Pseudonocardia sp.]|uniref:GlxA family transcriptional regulator n=1 Tax=Pseudonocardia sp. TaxID=60912 RepID=UPI002C35AE34|nr:DJ-1/PfpI family protein [Pseudonocardia sp.]HTF55093.1 DJ-1/PfpI family protein [Pseudonocardia sp.]